jgi:hypothetical protein
MGRPTSYTPELADEICDRIANGEPLRVICRDDGMPSWRTVYDWRARHPEFFTRIAQARDVGYDAIAEEALEIADTPRIGVRREDSDDGCKEIRDDMLGHRRLQVETRLKLLAKWAPKKYGDKIDVTTGGDSLNMSAEERQAKLQSLAALAAKRKAEQEDDGSDLA